VSTGAEQNHSTAPELTVLDLFCGAGGLSFGLQKAGFRVLGALDSWEPAVRTYAQNFSHPIVQRNIRATSASEFISLVGARNISIDLIAGGPPCQGFSVQRIGVDHDERNDLIFEFARFVSELKPRMFLMENVPGLLWKRGIEFARKFETILSSNGYAVAHARLNGAEYGLPQIRKRIYYYGWIRSVVPPFRFPAPLFTEEQFRTAWSVIKDLPAPTSHESKAAPDPLHRQTRLSELNAERLRFIPPGGGFEDLPVHMRVNCHKSGAEKIGHRYVYGRVDPDKPAPTITARFDSFTRGRFAHPYEHRNLTLREGARFQTFPDDFQFSGTQEGMAALIGNAVPPLLASIIGTAIHDHLCMEHRDSLEGRAVERQYELFDAHADDATQRWPANREKSGVDRSIPASDCCPNPSDTLSHS
jgi:DNA (cytosine-5)-methyltransferase 1